MLGIDKCLTVLDYVSQPSTFWRAGLKDSIGLFDDQYRNAMDYDYWLRIIRDHKLHFINKFLAKFRIYPTSITSSNSRAQYDDEFRVASRYSTSLQIFLHKIHAGVSCWIYEHFFNRK
jgi:hypothetical protein